MTMRNYRLLPSQSTGRRRLETWVTGSALLGDPMLNRGTAWTLEERKELGLLGLLVVDTEPRTLETPILEQRHETSNSRVFMHGNLL